MTSRKPNDSKIPDAGIAVPSTAAHAAVRDPLQRLFRDAKLGQTAPSKAQLERMQMRFAVAASSLGAHGTSTHTLPESSPWTTTGRAAPRFGAGLAAVGISLLLLARAPAPSAPGVPATDQAPRMNDPATSSSARIEAPVLEQATSVGLAVPPPASTLNALPRAVPSAEHKGAASKSNATTQSDPLLQGLRALEAAELALRAARFDEARRHLTKDVPQSLIVHRSALRAMLECAVGDFAKGRRLLTEHEGAFPASPYLARMRASCKPSP